MTADLELLVLRAAGGEAGYIAGFARTDRMLVAVGGSSNQEPTVLAAVRGAPFEPRPTPKRLGLRDALAVGDALWVCGEYGQLAVSRDHGATWKLHDTGTEGCLYALALGADGAIWVVGDDGYAARILGEQPRRVELGTSVRLSAVYAVRDEIALLGFDGKLRRWRDGVVTEVATGTTRPLTALALSRGGSWLVTGDGGFIGRSPDGTWFSRVTSGVDLDLEGIAGLPSGQLVAVGDRGLVLTSTDEGRTWRSIKTELGLAHLWAIERHGSALLIGGEEGLIAQLGAPAERTREVTPEVAPAAPAPRTTLDALFADGPVGFIAHQLEPYLAAVAEPSDEDEDDGGESEGEADDDDDDGDDDEDDGDEDGEVFRLLGRAGSAADFLAIYGAPIPPEASALLTTVPGRDKWRAFEELRLDNDLRPDVGEHNLFELMVRRNQRAYLGTDLVEAFSGVFGIGSQGNGDTYHMEIYAWDAPGQRQILHFDHETHAFTGVFADSLDSLVYLAAITKLGDAHRLSPDVYAAGLRALRGKLAPTWHYAIQDKDPEFVTLEPKRRDTEFFFYRSRWICALLKHDGVTEIEDVRGLFMADFNQVIPEDQLPARYEACEKFIPTALYAMWRAYLFDEPELARYLEIGRRHVARLVRDAARLIDELRGGRNQLGTIEDVGAWLAAFRALDLDPRRAAERAVEGEARAAREAAHTETIAAELARTPEASWSELAWSWLGDGVAHRALLAQLDRTAAASQIAALDELAELGDDERIAALTRVAAELSPSLEAVLVGSLVRDDALAGVLQRPAEPGSASGLPAEGDEDGDDAAPGWEAIDAALRPIYDDSEPLHFGVVVPYLLGGADPIHGISVYPRREPVPHWHFVTYGFTDLFDKRTEGALESGFGFELTLRLARALDDEAPPAWALNFLQNLGRYVFGSGNRFAVGHKMGLNSPIAQGMDTQLTAICFAEDPELGEFSSEFGTARFIQVVGITDDEYRLIQEWSTHGLIDILRKKLPSLVTDVTRVSVLADPEIAALADQRVAAEGSSEDLTFAGELTFLADDGRIRIELGALYAAVLPRAMRGRIRHGRPYELRGQDATLILRPSGHVGYRRGEGELVLDVTQELARELEVRLREALAGTYEFEAWPALEIVVTPSFIRAQDGTAAEVRGVADPEEVARLLAAENARLAAASEGEGEDDDEEDDDDDGDEADDNHEADAARDRTIAPLRVLAALAMTERALRLAPDDTDVQFTHAMLLLDGDRAEVAGKGDELMAWLPRFAPPVRINVAVRLGQRGHARFSEAVDVVLAGSLPASMFASTTHAVGGAHVLGYGDVAHELFDELGEAILVHAPPKLARLVPLLPDDVELLSTLATKALAASQREVALALWGRLLALPIPDDREGRGAYLRALNNACVQAHAAGAFETAVRIAERAQPVAHENPYLFHAAACAYAAVGQHDRALDQVRLAITHAYPHLDKVEIDGDLGPLLEWPEFKAMFRDWHARQEGN